MHVFFSKKKKKKRKNKRKQTQIKKIVGIIITYHVDFVE